MKITQSPLVRNLSMVVAALMAAVSLAGLLFQASLYPTDALRQSFVSNDVVNIFLGLPILLGSMELAKRGKLVGLLLWPGALLYVTYNYIAYSVAMPFTWQFIPYLALAGLSGFAVYRLFASLDQSAILEKITGKAPNRFAGGVLMFFGLLFFFRSLGVIFQSRQISPEVAVAIADLFITPLWVYGGFLLWRKQALGYAAGLGLLFQSSMLFLGLLVFFILQPFLAGVTFPVDDFVVIAVMGLIFFIPFGLFLRGVLQSR